MRSSNSRNGRPGPLPVGKIETQVVKELIRIVKMIIRESCSRKIMRKITSAMLLITAWISSCLWGQNAHQLLHPGGLEIDFFAGTEAFQARQKQRTSADNLLFFEKQDPKFSFGCNRGSVPEWNAEMVSAEQEMRKMVQSEIREVGGKTVYWLNTPLTINAYRDEFGAPIVWHRLMSSELLPVESGQKYRITFKLKGELYASPGSNSFVLTIDQFSAEHKKVGASLYHKCALLPNANAEEFSFLTGEETRFLRVHFGLSGCGTAEVYDVQMHTQMVDDYEVQLHPMATMDNQFHLASGKYGHLMFGQQVESGNMPVNPKMKLTLPAGFHVLGSGRSWGEPYTETKNSDGSTTLVFPVLVYQWERLARKDYSSTFPVLVLITTDLAPSEKLYRAEYQAIADNYQGQVKNFSLKVIPPFAGKRPKYFQTGVYDYRSMDTSNHRVEEFVAFYANMGFNCYFCFNWVPETSRAMKQAGIWRLASAPLHDGFLARGPTADKRPDYTHFLGTDGKPAHAAAICPNTVIQRSEYYREQILAPLQKKLLTEDACDFLMSNWEPGHFQSGSGCYCLKCKEQFQQQSGIAAAELDKNWPGQMITNFRKEWFDFKSWQHALYLETFEKDLKEIAAEAGKESGFMPMITRDLMLDTEFNFTADNAFAVSHYADRIDWINPWGPYLGYHWKENRWPPTGDRIRMLTAARSVVRYLDQVCGDPGKRPKLLAFPLGLCVQMTIAPAALKMDTLSVYIGGWQGSTPYYFPAGYDNRYWQALAEANTLIADSERFVIEGEKLPPGKGGQVTGLTAFPECPFAEFNAPDKPISALQIDSFRQGDDYLFAVANFWQRGEVFFRFVFSALPEGNRYHLRNLDGNLDYGSFQGSELAEGITLHCGALRWAFFVLQPESGQVVQNQSPVLSQTELKSLQQQRSKIIELAYAAELTFQKESQPPPESMPDYSMLQGQEHAGVRFRLESKSKEVRGVQRLGAYSTRISAGTDRQASLLVECGNDVCRVELSRGAFISSWQLEDGTELCVSDPALGLAMDGPWLPAARITQPMQLLKTEEIAGGLAVELERKLNLNDHQELAGLMLTKRMEFTHRQVRITSTLKNPYSDTIRFAYRYQNLPLLLASKDKQSGKAVLKAGQIMHEFKRDFNSHFLRMAGVSPDLHILRNMPEKEKTQVTLISAPEVDFVSPGNHTILSVRLTPAEDFHGFAVFDNPNLESCTFEPIFNQRELPVGQSWQAGMTLQVKQP